MVENNSNVKERQGERERERAGDDWEEEREVGREEGMRGRSECEKEWTL
jgi:hypothetical protein